VDGDTIEVAGGTKIRLIGMDTPEVYGGVECYGREASAHIAKLIPVGSKVRLEYDVERTDRYGRTLAYVWRHDGVHVNEKMVVDGFAKIATYPPNVKYEDRFLTAQRAARDADRGLWGSCPTEAPPAGGTAPSSSSGSKNPWGTASCHPAYDPCVPPPSETGDLNCPDIRRHYSTGVKVDLRHGDPHGLDGDKDGRGCE
jgi:micrococcal nuclease